MQRIESGFSLRVFDQRNARSRMLARYLVLYTSSFGPEHRTKTNELIEFLGTSPDERKILCFGLDHDDEPVGFAVLMYFPTEAVGVVDHLTITPNARGQGAFFCFCELIARCLERRGIQLEHVLAEIITDERVTAATIKPGMLIRLMRIIGFKVARVPYWAPDPLIERDKDGCKAALMIASQPTRGDMSAGRFTEILNLVYRKHYLDWYRHTLGAADFAAYAAAAEQARQEIEQLASKQRRVILNGVSEQDLKFIVDPTPVTDLPMIAYILVLILPAAVGAAVAFKQELTVAAVTAAASLILIAICLLFPRLRRALLRTFRLAE